MGGSRSSLREDLDSQPSRADQAAQRADRHLLMVRNGKRRLVPLPNQDDVTAALAGLFSSQGFENPYHLATAQAW